MGASPPPAARPMTPLGMALFAVAFLAAGLTIEAAAFGVIHPTPGPDQAPRWVIAVAGLAFLAGAFVPLTNRWGPDAIGTHLVGATVLVAIASLMHWVAFGAGTRHFSTTVSLGVLGVSGRDGGEWTGRAVFGTFALGLDAIVVAVVVGRLRRRLATSGSPDAPAGREPAAPDAQR